VTTAAIVLAAGRGSRLASAAPKPLVELGGRPLVDWAIDAARESGCAPVVLVVGHAAAAVAARAPADVRVVVAPDWADGISASVRAGIAALETDPEVTAACVGLADQPRIGAAAYRRLVAAADAGGDAGDALMVATYAGRRGNPVLVPRARWAEVRTLTGDEGARQLMGRVPVVEVDCTGTGDPADVDTLNDLVALGATDPRPLGSSAPPGPNTETS